MFRTALKIVAPRWRHFIPKAESLNIRIPFYESSRNEDGSVSVAEKFRFTITAGAVVEDDYTYFDLPAGVNVSGLDAVSISFDGVLQDNSDVVLYYTYGGTISIPHYGPKTFIYDAEKRRICFQRAVESGYNKAPVEGTLIEVTVVNSASANLDYVRIPMKREWRIQGANPIDPSLVNPNGTGSNQFQGGYRCTLKLISQAAHGHVRISDDKFALEYRPDLGYKGLDSFAYRLVNALGQESPAYCVRLEVGTVTAT